MEPPIPKKLFVCVDKTAPSLTEAASKLFTEGTPFPAELNNIRESHLRYVYDLGKNGIIWAGGPSADFTAGLSIFAVDSLEEAKKAQQHDPFYAHGLHYDDKYFEWTIHTPLSKVAPEHRERMKDSYGGLGIVPDE